MSDRTETRPDDASPEPRKWSRSSIVRTGTFVAAPLVFAGLAGRAIAGTQSSPPAQEESPEVSPEAAPEEAPPGPPMAPAPGDPSGAVTLQLTPEAADADDLTPTLAQTEGPYFKRNSPERLSLLEPGSTGTRLTVTGRVLTQNGRLVSRALLDFWQADAQGQYDNTGFKFRGHQFADENGRFHLDTIVAGLYPGRTRHIHVKVQAPNGPILTTQIYFPNEPRNATDSLFHPALLLPIQPAADGRAATFDFVIRTNN